MPLFEGDESIITSARTYKGGYSFGLKSQNPVLLEDDDTTQN